MHTSYNGEKTTLREVLLKPAKIPIEYYISPEDVLKPKGWKYLKGAKKEQREGTDGFTYSYNEGAMKFPDPLTMPREQSLQVKVEALHLDSNTL